MTAGNVGCGPSVVLDALVMVGPAVVEPATEDVVLTRDVDDPLDVVDEPVSPLHE
jgi:hypothetical protein